MNTPWLCDEIASNGRTVSENFGSWFGSSVVVERQNRPLTAFHFTSADFDEFDLSRSKRAAFGAGLYFTRNTASQKMRATVEGDIVMPVYLRIERPAHLAQVKTAMQAIGYDRYSFDQQVERGLSITAYLESQGFDGVDVGDGDLVVFRPSQVKSAIGNTGLYLKNSNSLTDLIADRALRASSQAKLLTPHRMHQIQRRSA